jgi:membrane protease YdiL (CAAX protease family)
MSGSETTPARLRTVAEMAVLGAAALIVGVLIGGIVTALVIIPLPIGATDPGGQLLVNLATYAGIAAVGALYLVRHERPLSYVRYRRPGAVELGIAAATVVALVALSAAIPVLVGRLGLPFVAHSIADSIEADPTIALVSIPLSVLVVGPAEEFVYRGIIQTQLRSVFEPPRAVAVAAVIFAVVHVLAYLDPANLPGTLVTLVFVLLPLGAVLGTVYEYTGNLVVPALAHGVYNAVTFALTYADTVGV